MRRLEKRGASTFVTASADPAPDVGLSGLAASQRQPQMRSNVSRIRKAIRPKDLGAEGERGDRTTPGTLIKRGQNASLRATWNTCFVKRASSRSIVTKIARRGPTSGVTSEPPPAALDVTIAQGEPIGWVNSKRDDRLGSDDRRRR